MARYRRFNCKTWVDPRFRRLSPMEPSAQGLYLYLQTNLSTTNIPGLYRAGEAAMAEDLGWPLQAFRRCFAEIADEHLAEADWKSRVIFIPEAIEDDPPTSGNTVTAWRATLEEIPDCPLKRRAVAQIRAHLQARGPTWIAAFEAVETQARDKRRPLDEATRNEIKARDGDECRYCGVPVNWRDRRGPAGGTWDYVDPEGAATIENIVVSCRACNDKKGFMTVQAAGMTLRPEPNRRQVVLKFAPKSDLDRDLDQDLDQKQILPGMPSGMPSGMASPIPDPDPDPDPNTDPDSDRVWGLTRRGTLSGLDLQYKFGLVRAAEIGGLPWNTPGDSRGQVEAFAAQLAHDEDALVDIVPTMRLACRRIKAKHEEWAHPGLKDPSFAFGAWRSKFTSLREELRGQQPVLRVAASGSRRFDPGAQTR